MLRQKREESGTGICHVMQGKESKPVPMIRIAASDYRITGLHPKICAPLGEMIIRPRPLLPAPDRCWCPSWCRA